MTDKTELKRLADELIAANDLFNESPQDNEVGDAWSLANDRFTEVASPESVLALLAENERLSVDEQEATGLCNRLSDLLRSTAIEVRGPEKPLKRHGFHDLPSRVKTVISERDQLQTENEALRKDAERYRGVRRVANRQGFTDEQFDQQTDARTANLDAAIGKGEQS